MGLKIQIEQTHWVEIVYPMSTFLPSHILCRSFLAPPHTHTSAIPQHPVRTGQLSLEPLGQVPCLRQLTEEQNVPVGEGGGGRMWERFTVRFLYWEELHTVTKKPTKKYYYYAIMREEKKDM